MICIDYNVKKQKGIISGEYFDIIREFFSVENPAARFIRRGNFIPKRLYAITPTGQFDVGMIGEIKKFLIDRELDVEIDLTDAAKRVIYPTTGLSITDNLSLPLRDYQTRAIECCLQNGRGVAVLGTGAGKTLICATLIESFFAAADPATFKCLLIVPDLGLVNQTHADFSSYGVTFKMTRWTGSIEPDLTANVMIANTAILQSRFNDNDWLKYVDLLIVDETHKAGKGTELSKMIQQIQTSHKFGFTGTLPEDKMNRWNILGKIGPVLIEKNSYELREENHLTNVSVKMIDVVYSNQLESARDSSSPALAYRNELEFIYQNLFRNKMLHTMCSNFNNNILLLVNHIDHGETLLHKMQSLADKQIFFIRGEVEVEDRDRVKQIMESNNNVVCIAISSIFSTGVNIKNIHMIIFAAGGKSFIRTVQSIGRGLRLHPTKDQLTIIDIADNLTYGRKHADKRREIYKQEKIAFTQHKVQERS